MSSIVDSLNGDLGSLFNLPETIEKLMFQPRNHNSQETRGVSNIPVDIMETPNEYVFYMDIPGLSKTDIQVNTYLPLYVDACAYRVF